MTHFGVAVLTTPTPDERALSAEITRLMAPYDENLEVPEYETDCGCIGTVARHAAHEQASAEVGTLDDFRKSFSQEIWPALQTPEDVARLAELARLIGEADAHSPESKVLKAEHRKHAERRQQAWEDYVQPHVKRAEHYEKEHPLYQKPDPDCEDCQGTGKRMTTYNPKSRWDYWTQYRKAPQTTAEAVQYIDEHGYPQFTALVTPDGQWHENGRTWWWAITLDEGDEEKWVAETRQALLDNPKKLLVYLDCHI